MDIEEALISHVLIERKMREVIEARVQDELFTKHAGVWKFITKFQREHGDAPPVDAFQRHFPEFEVRLLPDSPLTYLVEELRKRRVHNLVAESVREAAELLKTRDPVLALESLRKVILKAEGETRPVRDVNLAENAQARLKEYDDLVTRGGLLGLPSLWPVLDDITLGFQSEELWGIVARGGVGKTWSEVILSRYHWHLGFRPLLFSREMSVPQIIRRVDASAAELPYQRFRSGKLTTVEYERWRKYLEGLEAVADTNPFWVSGDDDGVTGVASIEAKIDRYRPHVVYIDGVYLVHDDEEAKGKWEKMANVLWGLKKLARRKGIPMIVSHQFNSEGKGEEGSADTLKFGDVQQWFDGLIGMYQTDDLRLNKEMLFRLLKQREGERLEWVAEWDLEHMRFDTKKGKDDVPVADSYKDGGDEVKWGKGDGSTD